MSDYQRVLQQVKQENLSSSEKEKVLKALPELKKAYDKQMTGSGKKRMKGRGFLDWLGTAFSDANQWLKDNKILSKIAGPVLEYVLPAAATLLGTPVSGAVIGTAGALATEGLKKLGYGMRGGDSRLVINLPGQRLQGKGMVGYSQNGYPIMGRGSCGKSMSKCLCGKGNTLPFYSASSVGTAIKF